MPLRGRKDPRAPATGSEVHRAAGVHRAGGEHGVARAVAPEQFPLPGRRRASRSGAAAGTSSRLRSSGSRWRAEVFVRRHERHLHRAIDRCPSSKPSPAPAWARKSSPSAPASRSPSPRATTAHTMNNCRFIKRAPSPFCLRGLRVSRTRMDFRPFVFSARRRTLTARSPTGWGRTRRRASCLPVEHRLGSVGTEASGFSPSRTGLVPRMDFRHCLDRPRLASLLRSGLPRVHHS